MSPDHARPADDPALQALQHALRQVPGLLPASGPILFLRARAGFDQYLLPPARLRCQQSFKPWAVALERAGYAVEADPERLDGHYPLVLLLPPRQRDEARALLARALQLAGPAGAVLAVQANTEGGRSLQADLARLTGVAAVADADAEDATTPGTSFGSLAKHKCRACWLRPGGARDTALLQQWALLEAPRAVAEGRYLSRPGLFAWDRVDAGTALLAAALPADLAGHGADLGAGHGVLAAELLERCPGVLGLDLYEAEWRALALAPANLARWQQRLALGYHWHDVGSGLPRQYDFIVSNPPFHAGRADLPELGRQFIRVAAAALVPGGRLLLVANRHLPYETLLRSELGGFATLRQDGGFKVLAATRGG